MKTLIVYYSRDGNTRKVAQQLVKLLKADLEEIIDRKNRSGLIGLITGSIDAALKKLTEIGKTKYNPEKYDLTVVGTPIWASTMTPTIRTYLTNNKFKKIAFFCTCSGSQGKSFLDMKQVSGKKPIATLELRTKDIKTNNLEPELKKFAAKLSK
jgi:flavodoxin